MGTSLIWFATRSKLVVSVRPPGRLARPVVSIVLTEPPPPEPSIKRMIGMRKRVASCSDIFGLPLIEASAEPPRDRKSTRLNSSHVEISYAVFCLKKKKKERTD